MYTEIESVEALREHLAQGGSLAHVVVQGVDLMDSDLEHALASVSADQACFLGCRMTDMLREHLGSTGAMLFPAFRDLPFEPYRSELYTPDELMQGYEPGNRESLEATVDARIYHHFVQHHRAEAPVPILAGLAYRIHDHAIDDALHDLLYPAREVPKRVVGVMGGHRMGRDAKAFEAVAHVAHRLAQQGYFVATGGGPGAMEAANLGAYLAPYPASALEAAVRRLAMRPLYTDDGYFEAAYAVRARYPHGRESLAVPTWFYGHEPSNLFASHVAKYFANSIREDGLLAIARHGVIYAPGSAGTVQEVFMDAAQNHYVTFGAVSPMVFFGSHFWTHDLPVYPLLTALAADKPYAALLTLFDDVDAVVRFITTHEPL